MLPVPVLLGVTETGGIVQNTRGEGHIDWRHSAEHERRRSLLVSRPCLVAHPVITGHHQGIASRILGQFVVLAIASSC